MNTQKSSCSLTNRCTNDFGDEESLQMQLRRTVERNRERTYKNNQREHSTDSIFLDQNSNETQEDCKLNMPNAS